MSTINETIIWEPTVNQVEAGELIDGGAVGRANAAVHQLANRTAFLKDQIENVAGGDAQTLQGHPASDFSLVGHNHAGVYTPISHSNDDTLHRIINDTIVSDIVLWSSYKIQTSLNAIDNNSVVSNHINDVLLHRTINDFSTEVIYLWSANKINNEIGMIDTTITNHINDTESHRIPWVLKTSNYTMPASESINVFADTSSGIWTLTLSSTPTIGQTIRICDVANTWAQFNLTINSAGGKINGLSENIICDTNNCSFELIYCNTTYGWKVM